MKTNIKPLSPNTFYHVYNRGNNGEVLFKEDRNYLFFLQKYSQYIEPIADTYAYCLLSNHFHFLIKTKSEAEVREAIKKENIFNEDFAQSEVFIEKHRDKAISWIFGNAFSSLFKSYTQAINKAYHRTGRLFEAPFRRIEVDNEIYFTKLIYYIHHNPQKHGFVKDFRDYPHSSYHSMLHTAQTKLQREKVIQWFGNRDEYEKFHLMQQVVTTFPNIIIEVE